MLSLCGDITSQRKCYAPARRGGPLLASPKRGRKKRFKGSALKEPVQGEGSLRSQPPLENPHLLGEATRKPPPPTENASIYPSLKGRGLGRVQPTSPESRTQNKRGFLRGESDFARAKSSP